VGQLSFYSADAHPHAVTDLEGVLCARGQLSVFGRGATARLSIVLGDPPPPPPEEGPEDDEGALDAPVASAVLPARRLRGAAPHRRAARPAVPVIDPEELAFLDLEPEDLARLALGGPDADPDLGVAPDVDADTSFEDVDGAGGTGVSPDGTDGRGSTPDAVDGAGSGAGPTAGPTTVTALPDPVAEWRARALRCAFAVRGIDAELDRAADGRPVVRSAYRADLVALAQRWRRGAVKALPPCFELDGPRLRTWVLAAGRPRGGAYLRGLDPQAGHTHEPLLTASRRAGLTAVIGGDRAEPVIRIAGRRAHRRLAELVGDPPRSVVDGVWPG
jgi:hypothetical protein